MTDLLQDTYIHTYACTLVLFRGELAGSVLHQFTSGRLPPSDLGSAIVSWRPLRSHLTLHLLACPFRGNQNLISSSKSAFSCDSSGDVCHHRTPRRASVHPISPISSSLLSVTIPLLAGLRVMCLALYGTNRTDRRDEGKERPACLPPRVEKKYPPF